ncbi:hypothetical protein ACFODZ_15870 [Marinicella sediminis]|uniref:Uncharacterized protein n=1 Tax=Marinicella sediminis TaxID=1792834 RepID=A0ABV7JFY9_9GAMM|nr:hypothetical protein [Marinicella sediminis]
MTSWQVEIWSIGGLLLMIWCWFKAQQSSTGGRQLFRVMYVLLSLLLLALSHRLWSMVSGPEFSVLYVLFHISWVAWLLIASRATIKYKTYREKQTTEVKADYSRRHKCLVFLLAAPIALITAVCLAVWFSRLLVSELANQWVLTFILVPLLWGCLAVWFAAERRLIRPAVFSLMVIPLSMLLL